MKKKWIATILIQDWQGLSILFAKSFDRKGRVLETAERCAVIARKVIADAQRGMTQEEQSVCRSFLSRIIASLNDIGS
ncbi:MAG: hypothetical protein AB7U43_13740 [Desulfobacter sp.]